MEVHELCVAENLAWCGQHYDAYWIKSENEPTQTVFQYDIPFKPKEEAIHFSRYGISQSERTAYYSQLARCIGRQFDIMKLLKSQKIPSILTFRFIHKEENPETGISSIYFRTEEVNPIMDKLFREQINLLTLMDVFIRLSVIIRDISKSPCCLSHRGINMDEVYLTADNKILLGGFYYAVTLENNPLLASEDYNKPLPYLPEQGQYLPKPLLNGEHGSAGTDMQTICRIMFNLCSGLPWDTAWTGTPNVAPDYIPEELIQVLNFGMTCTDADCNTFRRRLLDCRKALSKTEAAQIFIPVRKPLLKEFSYE